MFQTTTMSNSTSWSEEASASSDTTRVLASITSLTIQQESKKVKRKRGLPGNPDPDAEVLALSPRTLVARNRYVCEICKKGFQREQNMQLHRRGHNLPWKLKQRDDNEVKKKRAYVCPEPTCVHHHPSRALGDLTGIKKHFSRKHGEKKFKCDKCSRNYAVYTDLKAHLKICGTREYKCECGTLFSRKDRFVSHRGFCDALSEQQYKAAQAAAVQFWGYYPNPNNNPATFDVSSQSQSRFPTTSFQSQLQAPTHQTLNGFGSLCHVDPLLHPLSDYEYMEHAAWQKGPPPGHHQEYVSVSVNDVLRYAGVLNYTTPPPPPPILQADNNKHYQQQQGYEFGSASENWGHQN